MRRFQPIFVVAITLAVGSLAGGCSRVQHVNPAVFVWKARTPSTSIHDVNFVGVFQNRACLSEWRHWPVIGSRTRLLWTEANRLSPALLRELEAVRVQDELEAKRSREAQAAAAKLRP